MQVVNIGDDDGIDVCANCGGVFLDFFDGDPTTLARQLIDQPIPPNEVSELHLPCPDCRVEMKMHAYLGDGPPLSQCLRCMGIFLSFDQRQSLAAYHESDVKIEPGHWLARLLEALS